MDNYKIKVTDEVSNTEIQEALFELGCEWFGSTNEVKPLANCWIDVGSNGRLTWSFHGSDEKELTLPKLRDLVVLKRNDVKDANVEDGTGFPLYLSSTNELYVNDCEWKLSKKNGDLDYICKLKLIHRPQDPALISGADALRALADGKEVIGKAKDYDSGWHDAKHWTLTAFIEDTCYFKLKPQTIKLELELPKPFEPKVGEWFYYLSAEHEDGYGSRIMHDDTPRYLINLGAYRTEDEIKQVVEQLRKIRGTNS